MSRWSWAVRVLALPAALSAVLVLALCGDRTRGSAVPSVDVEAAAAHALLQHLPCPAGPDCEASGQLAVACTARAEGRHDCVAASPVRVDGLPSIFRLVGVYSAEAGTFSITWAEPLLPDGERPAAA